MHRDRVECGHNVGNATDGRGAQRRSNGRARSAAFLSDFVVANQQQGPVTLGDNAPGRRKGGNVHVANSESRFLKALNSSALPEGSRKNMVACSPGWPLKRM